MKTPGICFALALSAVLCAGCSTRPKVYRAPSEAGVVIATRKVEAAIANAHANLEAARQETAAIVTASAEIEERVDELAAKVPEELRAEVDALKTAIVAQRGRETQLVVRLHDTAGDVAEADKAKNELRLEQTKYAGEAKALAFDATFERNERIAAEKQLVREKVVRVLWKVGGGVAVVGAIILAFLYFTGRVAFRLAPIAAKAVL